MASSLIFCGAASATGSYTWTAVTGLTDTYCYNMASSSTGQYVACSNYGGDLLTSSDYGATWVDQTVPGSHEWNSIAMSANGQYLLASIYNGDMYVSNDYGATWVDQTSQGSAYWGVVAVSGNGQYMIADDNGNNVDISSDYGSTWAAKTVVSGSADLFALSVSSTGQYMQTANYTNGYVYTSSDYGNTWTPQTSSGQQYWGSLASSANGQYVAAVGYSGDVYVSSDYGANWTTTSIPGAGDIYSVVMSGDGKTLIASDATSSTGYIYESYDYGVTWTQDANAGTGQGWYSIAGSSDLSKVYAVDNDSIVWSGSNPSLVASQAGPSAPSPSPTVAATISAPNTGYGAPSNDGYLTIVAIVTLIAALGTTGYSLRRYVRKLHRPAR